MFDAFLYCLQSDPYGMLRLSSVALKNNERFEGFGIELIHELSLMLGFNYTFELQRDNAYGSLNKKTNQWNGMIRELLEEVTCALDFVCVSRAVRSIHCTVQLCVSESRPGHH
jgi:hypothetical protein